MDYVNRFIELASGAGLASILIMLVLVFISGTVRAIVKKEFTFTDLGKVLGTKIVPITAGFFLVVAFAVIDDTYQPAITAAAALADATLVANIIQNLNELGVPIPDWLNKVTAKRK